MQIQYAVKNFNKPMFGKGKWEHSYITGGGINWYKLSTG